MGTGSLVKSKTRRGGRHPHHSEGQRPQQPAVGGARPRPPSTPCFPEEEDRRDGIVSAWASREPEPRGTAGEEWEEPYGCVGEERVEARPDPWWRGLERSGGGSGGGAGRVRSEGERVPRLSDRVGEEHGWKFGAFVPFSHDLLWEVSNDLNIL